MTRRQGASVAAGCTAALALLLGCSADEPVSAATPTATPTRTSTGTAAGEAVASEAGHDHTHTGGETLPPAGDGTSAYQIGYMLSDVRLPKKVGEPGRLSLVIENFRGRPQTGFLTEQSKDMHVYVVRDDLGVFRHVHPTMRRDGTWTGRLTLPEAGPYRVVTEFMARDEGGDGDFVMLGDRVRVPGQWKPRPLPAEDGSAGDWGVEAEVVSDVTAGADGELRIRLTTPTGEAPNLGEYLGTSAHLTGFHVETGGAVHMHPLATPAADQSSKELAFHTSLPTAGRYLLFLQVIVDGFLHTLPIAVTAG